MNVNSFYSELAKRLGRDGKEKVMRDYSPVKKITYSETSELVEEAKRHGTSSFNGDVMKLEKKCKDMIKKDKGDKKLDRWDLERLLDILE